MIKRILFVGAKEDWHGVLRCVCGVCVHRVVSLPCARTEGCLPTICSFGTTPPCGSEHRNSSYVAIIDWSMIVSDYGYKKNIFTSTNSHGMSSSAQPFRIPGNPPFSYASTPTHPPTFSPPLKLLAFGPRAMTSLTASHSVRSSRAWTRCVRRFARRRAATSTSLARSSTSPRTSRIALTARLAVRCVASLR